MAAEVRDIIRAILDRRLDGPEVKFWNRIIQYVEPFKRTPAEIAAGVTPTNYSYPPGNVKRYGATGDGVTNDAPAFQQAINLARYCGIEVIVPETPQGGAYLLTSPLDCTISSADALTATNILGFTIRGTHHPLAFSANAPQRPSILVKHTGHAFDCSGSYGINFENLSIGTDVATYPQTCWFKARNSGGGGSIHRNINCRVHGKFSEAIDYNYGAEDDIHFAPDYTNTEGGANAKIFVFTRFNIRGLTSSFLGSDLATGAQSCIGHLVLGGSLDNQTNHASGDVIVLDSVASLKVIGPWMGCGTEAVGASPRSLIYVDGTNGSSDIIKLQDITGENLAAIQSHAIALGGTARTHSHWDVQGNTLPNSANMLYADTGHGFSNLNWRANGNQSIGGGINIAGNVINSSIEELLAQVSIGGTSTNNVIKANSSVLTIGVRDGDYLIDSAKRTWTANTSNLTVTGALTVNNNRFHFHGQEATATVIMSAATSIVCAAGTAIPGLLATATAGAAHGIVEDVTNNTIIGPCHASGTSVILPAINKTTEQIAIRLTYFVS